MANIQNYLNQIKTAVFGKDVRESIHNAIKQCYDDAAVNHDNANMEVKLARGSYNTLNDRLDENEKVQENFSSQLDNITKNIYYYKDGDNLNDLVTTYDCIILPSGGTVDIYNTLDIVNKTLISNGKPCTINLTNDILTSALYLGGRFKLENVIINCNTKCIDGITIESSDRGVINNVSLCSSKKSGIVIKATKDWHWIENLQLNNVDLFNIGGHGFYFEVGDHQANFINECSFKNVEIRGIGQMNSDSSFIYANCQGKYQGNKMSVITWENCNFDANRQQCNDNGYELNEHMAIFKNTRDKNCLYEAWSFNGGGWESVSGTPFQNGYTFYCEDGAICKRFVINGITTYNWTNGKIYNIEDRLGSTLTSSYHIPQIEKIDVKNTLKSVGNYIQGKEFTRLTFKINDVDTSKTKDYKIPFDFSEILTSDFSNNFCFGKIILMSNKWRDFYGDGFAYTEYDFALQKVSWEEQKSFIFEKFTKINRNTTLTLNTLTYNIATKEFILNITSAGIASAGGSDGAIYGMLEISSNIRNEPNFIFDN